jgi:UDP-glucuronate decarboxylase
MRIMVAGGAGFIGSHLCERLHGEGHELVCVDDLSTGRRQNLSRLAGSNRFEFIEHDVVEPLQAKVDFIVNLASPASPPTYQADPVRTLETNVIGTLNLLKLAETLGAPLLQASTSEIYGDPMTSPQVETDWGHVNPVGVRSCYDEGKRAAETLCADFKRSRGVETKIARIFNTYGPYMDPEDGRVVSNFIVQALQHQDITVYGDGTQTRSFCYVSDMVDGLCALMKSEVSGPLNLGNPIEMTMLELAEQVLALTGSKSNLVYVDLPQDDPKQRRPDISRARQQLGWQPRVSLVDGLKNTIAYFKHETRHPKN